MGHKICISELEVIFRSLKRLFMCKLPCAVQDMAQKFDVMDRGFYLVKNFQQKLSFGVKYFLIENHKGADISFTIEFFYIPLLPQYTKNFMPNI